MWHCSNLPLDGGDVKGLVAYRYREIVKLTEAVVDAGTAGFRRSTR